MSSGKAGWLGNRGTVFGFWPVLLSFFDAQGPRSGSEITGIKWVLENPRRFLGERGSELHDIGTCKHCVGVHGELLKLVLPDA